MKNQIGDTRTCSRDIKKQTQEIHTLLRRYKERDHRRYKETDNRGYEETDRRSTHILRRYKETDTGDSHSDTGDIN